MANHPISSAAAERREKARSSSGRFGRQRKPQTPTVTAPIPDYVAVVGAPTSHLTHPAVIGKALEAEATPGLLDELRSRVRDYLDSDPDTDEMLTELADLTSTETTSTIHQRAEMTVTGLPPADSLDDFYADRIADVEHCAATERNLAERWQQIALTAPAQLAAELDREKADECLARAEVHDFVADDLRCRRDLHAMRTPAHPADGDVRCAEYKLVDGHYQAQVFEGGEWKAITGPHPDRADAVSDAMTWIGRKKREAASAVNGDAFNAAMRLLDRAAAGLGLSDQQRRQAAGEAKADYGCAVNDGATSDQALVIAMDKLTDHEQRHRRMEQAAASFDRGFDPSIAFAVRDLLEEIRTDTTLMTSASSTVRLTTPTLLASRGAFDLDLRIIDATAEQDTAGLGGLLLRADREGVAVDANASGQIYVGVMPVVTGNVRTGWILVHATPHVLPEEAATPLLHSLLSSGYRGLYANFSQASFRDGMLDRSVGRSFRHVALDEEVARSLQDAPDVWRFDTHGDRQYETYYLRRSENHIVGVRAAVVLLIDHLYYLLRIIVAGLIVGVPFYIVGLILRRSAGKLPAKRVRFRDKMLNAFLVMAIIVVIPVGIVGVGIITEENTKAMQSWLRNYLQLVELSLSAEAQGEEVSIDSLAARFGLDLNLYEKENLVASSRSLLVEDRLTDVRLPIQAYEALLVDGYEFVAVAQQTGNLRYTAGYHALLNEQGQPDYVLSIPTLAEQERIDEERVRTLSYLFGALLALVSLVMFTAAIMASALASPLARFQQGLKAVAQGRFEQRLQVQTRDEVGQLVSTFNDMQHQLAESRRQLTRQERQLAWREMARQVAHEIKNPLTPMKLSLQHLQRAYETRRKGDDASFSKLFRDKTSALIEEIGSLARIANEFASFARMPERIMERLDLVEVIRESASLMQTEADSGISFEVQLPEEALIVEADRQELKRIYVNLFKNALEAMREDVEGRIVATARREKGMAYSSVSDTGCGIPDELQDKIFEPSFSTKTSGTGLGLAIARHSIAVLGGTIGFEPQLSGGTLFFVRLPLVS